MKKLLSLLSFLTISGSAMPMVIAAAPHQKTNNLENNEKTPNINLENNKQDLKNLNIKNNNEIFTTPRLHINGNANEYFNNLKEILKSLLDNELIQSLY
jgi:hypothetical protein